MQFFAAGENMSLRSHTLGCTLFFATWNNFFFPFPVKESRRRSRVSPLLRLLTLGLSGRFWLHASLPRFRQIGFLWPWQSLALPLAVILGFLSLMEAQTVSSIHRVTPPAAVGGGPSGSLTTGQSQSLWCTSRSAVRAIIWEAPQASGSLQSARCCLHKLRTKVSKRSDGMQPDSEKGPQENTFSMSESFLMLWGMMLLREKLFTPL